MARSERRTHTVRPGIVLLCLVVLLAAVIVGGYRVTHPRSADTDSLTVQRPQSISLPATTAATTPTAPTPKTTQDPPSTISPSGTTSINRVAVANGFRIDVLSMQCDLTEIGPTYATLAATPGAQYCLVRLNAVNITSSPNIWGGGGTAYDARGNAFSSESDAELYVSNSALLQPVNPGITVPDIVPFEIPQSDRLVRIEFYSGFNSPSVSLPLT